MSEGRAASALIDFLDYFAAEDGRSYFTDIPLSMNDYNSAWRDLKVLRRNLKSSREACTTHCSDEKYWSSKTT